MHQARGTSFDIRPWELSLRALPKLQEAWKSSFSAPWVETVSPAGRHSILRDNDKLLPKQSCLSELNPKYYVSKENIHSSVQLFTPLFNSTDIYCAPGALLWAELPGE